MKKIERERRLLNIWIVRASVILCLAFIITGLTLYFVHGGQILNPPAGSLAHILRGILAGSAAWHAQAFLDAGLLILLLTPMVRLLAGVYVSLRMRDGLYAVIGLVVVGLVVIGLLAGQSRL